MLKGVGTNMKFVSNILDRIFVVLGALIFVQIPLFIQQYHQQLSGHVAELRLQVEVMRDAALHSGKTLEQYIKKFVDSKDVDFSRQGQIMSDMVERFHQLADSLKALDSASVITRPFEFLWHYKYDISSDTFEKFSIGLPLTFEGLVYLLLGMGMGYLLYALLRSLFSKTK